MTRPFSPIAIVGQACLLPGANSPAALWEAVEKGSDLLGEAPPDRWGLDPRRVTGTFEDATDKTWSRRGGYVEGFEALFDPEGFAIPAEEVSALDPLVQWLLHCGREALEGAGMPDLAKAGAIIGNLSFPSTAMARRAERTWLGDELAEAADLPASHPSHRFMSGLPAHLLARGLGLSGAAFCLDAACASSLVAIKLACDRLHDGEADVMLAGAVSCADDLFIHIGFCALQAMSRVGQSRPFHPEADGLVPAEGAGIVVLMRLEDAIARGRPILGVIRGAGLSNDGRGQGLLAPTSDGQLRALAAAYEGAGLAPEDIDYVECHATGTPTGDGVEAETLRRCFADRDGALPIGSLKANLGHLITAAGVAGLIKVLAAMERGTLPPTPHLEAGCIGGIDGERLRVLRNAEPWPCRGEGAPRRAAVSAFGFGGNNAHVVVEQWVEGVRPAVAAPPVERVPVAIVAVAERLLADEDEVVIPLAGLRFPPKDLELALPQQLLALELAGTALASLDQLPTERTGVFMGMGCDPTIARYGARWRLPDWASRWGVRDRGWTAEAQDAFVGALSSAGVLGTMPNIVANRINSSLDLGGGSASVSSEELSGLRALELAVRALREGELDAALVGAVDFSREVVHEAALVALTGQPTVAADGGVVLVVERLADAERLGHPVLAVIDDDAQGLPRVEVERSGAHAAEGLLALSRLVTSFGEGGLGGGTLHVEALEGQAITLCVSAGAAAGVVSEARRPEGPVLRFAPHAPPVALPAWPNREDDAPVAPFAPRSEVTQRMAPAPRLEPIVQGDSPRPDLGPAPAPRASARAAVASVASGPPPVAPSVAVSAAASASASAAVAVTGARSVAMPPLARHRQHVAAQHQTFLTQQARIHQRFLEAQARSQQALAQAYAVRGRGASRPVGPRRIAPRLGPFAFRAPGSVPSAPPFAPTAPVPSAPETAASPAPPSAAAPNEGPAPILRQPTGMTLDREGLMVHAGGAISTIFGPEFAEQDGYERQVRMPLPPLLLADRMTGLDAEPCSMTRGGLGTIWTETDVRDDSWYLFRGRMPAGLMIESGQADLMLISYLGADLLNKSERVYRLLGCELTYHEGGLPKPGDTLQYEIHVDGHAEQGDVRLFFFHYDCIIDGQPRLTVRGGQAGFFTDEELDDSAGILWKAETGERCDDPRLDPPPRLTERRAFDAEQVRAFAEGRARDCFGPGFDKTCAHTDTPTISGGRMLFFDEVTDFDPQGGPWGRGYLRAVDTITPDDWFFEGHFHNDPCMPGTLMFEGCLQTMAFYMAALGFTIERDGWRFEPVPEERYLMRCRGQVIPRSKELIYEVFIEEVVDGDTPMIFADLLCTVDGLGAFHCRRMGLRLVPDWPLERILKERPELLSTKAGPVAEVNGFAFDHHSLLACAWGRPTEAFGPIYAPFDSHRTVARLPGPPYHFMTRVASIDGAMGSMEPGQTIEVEYDVPPDAWYFDDNGARTMPMCVLMEAALQPCGWLASYVGSALSADIDLAFRNLDGTGNLKVDILPDAGTLRTRSTITSISSSGGMIIESFEVECFLGDTSVYEMKTVFGFFPKEALESQAGLSVPASEQGVLEAPSERSVDLTTRPARYFEGGARLPSDFLMMFERITGIWPEGGDEGLGRYRSELHVDPDAWFLKAHFFQDPVQPGSLGIEAMIQLLQFAMLDRGMDEGVQDARFEPIGLGLPCTWKYRGQVRVHNQRVHCIVDLTEVGEDEHGRYAVARASLYCDGMRIYEAQNLGMRIVSGGTPPPRPRAGDDETLLDPETDRWLADHCPTYTVPALPMMSMVDRLAEAAQRARPDQVVVGLDDVQVERWLPIPAPVRTKTAIEPREDGTLEVTLLAFRQAPRAQLSRFESVARGVVRTATAYPSPPARWEAAAKGMSAERQDDPYAEGHLFHGPAFHKLERLVFAADGASATLDATPGDVPAGALNQVLLDAATHAIPHDRLHRWTSAIGDELVAYPYRIEGMQVFGPAPAAGKVRCEVRFAGFGDDDAARRFPRFDLQLAGPDAVWCQLRLVEIALPKGPLGTVPASDRIAFLRDRDFVEGMRLSEVDGATTTLTEAEVKASNWLPGTLEALYDHADGATLVEAIAQKEHVAAEASVHPSTVRLLPAGAVSSAQPLTRHPLIVERDGPQVSVRAAGSPEPHLDEVRAHWDDHFREQLVADRGRWPVEDLYYGLIERFVRRVHVVDPAAFEAVRGKSILYLANHQTAIESLLFSIAVSGLSRTPTVTLAKIEHQHTWLGQLIQHCFAYPGIVDPKVITYFDRSDPTSLASIIGDLAAEMMGQGPGNRGKSVMVHVEGTRSFSCRQPLYKMSSAFIDMALTTRAHVVPVRFVGGLPGEPPLETRTEFPLDMGQQDIHLGRPIPPETFEATPYKERKAIVIDAVNAMGPSNADEEPFAGDADLVRRVAERVARTGVIPEHATLFEILADRARDRPMATHPMIAQLVAADGGALDVDDSPRGRWLAELGRRLLGTMG